jgi:ADP-ribose pyrophosphatase
VDDYEVLSEKTIFDGYKVLLKVYRFRTPAGREIEREIVHHAGAAAIAAFLDRETVLMVRHYRESVREYLWEIPAGTLNPPESPLECAERELVEETGYRAGRMKLVTEYFPSPGVCDEMIRIYRADDLEKVRNSFDETEIQAVVPMTARELQGKFKSGKLPDGKTITALKILGVI